MRLACVKSLLHSSYPRSNGDEQLERIEHVRTAFLIAAVTGIKREAGEKIASFVLVRKRERINGPKLDPRCLALSLERKFDFQVVDYFGGAERDRNR